MDRIAQIARHAHIIRYDEKERCCGNCKHFRQHYIQINENRYMPLDLGHCTEPRLKDRTVLDVCVRFERGDSPMKYRALEGISTKRL